jgi:hypothetical protein
MPRDRPEPYLIPVQEGFALIGVKPTKGYSLIHDGTLDARKAGGRTVLTMESIHRYIDSLPPVDLQRGPRVALAKKLARQAAEAQPHAGKIKREPLTRKRESL